jgi:hypothetical protein
MIEHSDGGPPHVPPPDTDTPPPPPRWVKIVGVLILVFVIVFVGKHLLGGGMGRHGAP